MFSLQQTAVVKQSTLVIVTYEGLKKALHFDFIKGKKQTRRKAIRIIGRVKRLRNRTVCFSAWLLCHIQTFINLPNYVTVAS